MYNIYIYYRTSLKNTSVSGASYGSREGTSDFRLQTSDFRLRTSDFRLQTSDLVRHWFRASLIANIAFAKLANI
jgi:hypothetical protein